MPPRSPAPARPSTPALGERFDRRRDRLVDGAARVFATRGYERTSVKELAEGLGIATGGIYHYFPGKEALLVAICDQLMDPLLRRAEVLTAELDDPEERFRSLLRLWVSHVLEHRSHLLVFSQVRHLVDHGEPWREVRRSRKQFEELLDRSLRAAGPNGDERLVLSALLGMVNHTVQWYRPRGRLRPRRIADGYADLALGR